MLGAAAPSVAQPEVPSPPQIPAFVTSSSVLHEKRRSRSPLVPFDDVRIGREGGSEVDPETSNAIESLRQDLGQRITAVEDVLRGEIRGLREELRWELHGETGKLRAEIHDVRGEMHEMREELMRHAMVLTDSVRDDIRIVADGVAAVSAKLDTLRR